MYFHGIGAAGDFYGPPRPGQSNIDFQAQQRRQDVIAGGAILATAMLVNPVVAGIGLFTYLSQRGKPKNKPKVQGG